MKKFFYSWALTFVLTMAQGALYEIAWEENIISLKDPVFWFIAILSAFICDPLANIILKAEKHAPQGN